MDYLLIKEDISNMRLILKEDYLKIPTDDNGKHLVELKIKARKVTVKGPRGEITKDFSHKPIDLRLLKMT